VAGIAAFRGSDLPKPRLLLDWIVLDGSDALPKYRQLYFQLRSAIVSGRLTAGSLLPSSRMLSQELGVSRNTVLNAYEQLAAEGYLESSVGSATSVAPRLAASARQHAVEEEVGSIGSQRAQRFMRSVALSLTLPDNVAFTPGVPAFDEFPRKVWSRLVAEQSNRMQPEIADNDMHVGGYGPLRESLALYLRSARMVMCEPAQIFIVSSARAGLDIISRLVADADAAAIMEDPGYNTARDVMHAVGFQVIPIPVDAEGLRIDVADQLAPRAQLAFVTPSHQWPTGVSLSAQRRKELLEWTERVGAWIVEDDYDSEFHFASRPLATLQGLDGGRRVFYTGTFSKVLFPSLRVAYVVVPGPFVELFRRAVFISGQEPALHIQAALAEFIDQGFFSRHIRRMRSLYARRQALLVDALIESAGDSFPVERPAGGMQMALSLPQRYPAMAVTQTAARAGLHVRSIEMYALSNPAPNALHLGFAAVPDGEIRPAAEALVSAILAAR
jgi:GntR family transcriptional regulator/MocR family aminotransferase